MREEEKRLGVKGRRLTLTSERDVPTGVANNSPRRLEITGALRSIGGTFIPNRESLYSVNSESLPLSELGPGTPVDHYVDV